MSGIHQRLSGKSIWRDAEHLRPLLLGTALPPSTAGQVFNKIIVTHRSGAAEFFEPTDAGWDAAAAACTAWCSMQSPPAVYSQAHTLPDQVMYLGAGSTSTIHNATLTIGASCYVREVRIDIDANDANTATGLIGPDAGESWANTLSITVDQAGAGTAVGILLQDGKLDIEGSTIRVNGTGAGDAYGIHVTGVGDLELWTCVVEGIAAEPASGYGIHEDPGGGVLFMSDGWLIGSTLPAGRLGDVAPESYTLGSEIATGAVNVQASGGTAITGLTIGQWYALEAFNGPWNSGGAPTGAPTPGDNWSFNVNNGGGWSGQMGLGWAPGTNQSVWRSNMPVWGALFEAVDSQYGRMYFQATTTSISFRVGDDYGPFGDNSKTLSWRLYNVAYDPGGQTVTDTRLVTSGGVRMYPVAGEPALGERAAWNALNWAVRHANDIDDAAGIHHTLTALDGLYAAADHTHVEADITDLDHTDAAAIHDNVDSEINAIAEKTSPADDDLLLIEDSAASYAKKKVKISNLPGGTGTGTITVQEEDSDPSVEVTTIIVPNGSITASTAGDSVTLQFGTGAESAATKVLINRSFV